MEGETKKGNERERMGRRGKESKGEEGKGGGCDSSPLK